MTNLIPFDKDGPLGSSSTLLFKFNTLEQHEIISLTNIVCANFENQTKRRASFFDDFIKFSEKIKIKGTKFSPLDLIQHPFLQSMQRSPINEEIHRLMIEKIMPAIFKTIKKEFNIEFEIETAIIEWMAKVMESYMSETQIKQTASINMDEELKEKRGEIGKSIYISNITENDLSTIVDSLKMCNLVTNNCDNKKLALNFIGKYLQLVSDENAQPTLLDNICDLLGTVFRNKKFPKHNQIIKG